MWSRAPAMSPLNRALLTVGPKPREKGARLALMVKVDGNRSGFQLAASAPALSITDAARTACDGRCSGGALLEALRVSEVSAALGSLKPGCPRQALTAGSQVVQRGTSAFQRFCLGARAGRSLQDELR